MHICSGNFIGAEGSCALAESLKQNTTLTQLDLAGDFLGTNGARALAESLKQNTTLTQLDLSCMSAKPMLLHEHRSSSDFPI